LLISAQGARIKNSMELFEIMNREHKTYKAKDRRIRGISKRRMEKVSEAQETAVEWPRDGKDRMGKFMVRHELEEDQSRPYCHDEELAFYLVLAVYLFI
jgi:hypothetical protein